MTKKLEALFDLPEFESESLEQQSLEQEEIINLSDKLELADRINNALPSVHGLGNIADDELNDIANKALTAYEDLMDLGMNVDSRYSSKILEVASSLLKTSLEAKTAKLDKKLKMIELQLKQDKLEKDNAIKTKMLQQKQSKSISTDNIIEGEGYIITDRNSLLEKLKNLDK